MEIYDVKYSVRQNIDMTEIFNSSNRICSFVCPSCFCWRKKDCRDGDWVSIARCIR